MVAIVAVLITHSSLEIVLLRELVPNSGEGPSGKSSLRTTSISLGNTAAEESVGEDFSHLQKHF